MSTSGSTSWGTRFAVDCRGRDWRPVRQLPPGGRQRRAQTHRAGDPLLALAPLVRLDPHEPRTSDQHDRAGMDQLLRALLPLAADPASQTHQRIPRSLGPMEIQAAAPLPRQGTQVPRRGLSTRARPVRPLALRRAPRRLDDGSRMSREAHVRFYERRGTQLPRRLTRQRRKRRDRSSAETLWGSGRRRKS